jgi:hypothetical protein
MAGKLIQTKLGRNKIRRYDKKDLAGGPGIGKRIEQ